MYKNTLKEVKGNQKYLIFPDLQDKNFEILRSAIILNKVDLVCAETVNNKSNGNDSGFIIYQKMVYGQITMILL